MSCKGVGDGIVAFIERRRDASGLAPRDIGNPEEEEAATYHSPELQHNDGAPEGPWDVEHYYWSKPENYGCEEEVYPEVCQVQRGYTGSQGTTWAPSYGRSRWRKKGGQTNEKEALKNKSRTHFLGQCYHRGEGAHPVMVPEA